MRPVMAFVRLIFEITVKPTSNAFDCFLTARSNKMNNDVEYAQLSPLPFLSLLSSDSLCFPKSDAEPSLNELCEMNETRVKKKGEFNGILEPRQFCVCHTDKWNIFQRGFETITTPKVIITVIINSWAYIHAAYAQITH